MADISGCGHALERCRQSEYVGLRFQRVDLEQGDIFRIAFRIDRRRTTVADKFRQRVAMRFVIALEQLGDLKGLGDKQAAFPRTCLRADSSSTAGDHPLEGFHILCYVVWFSRDGQSSLLS